MKEGTVANPRWWGWGLAGVFLLALAVRLFVLQEISDSPAWKILFIDSAQYDAWAKRIASGDWLGEGVFFMAPLYPYFLGVVYLLLGTDLTGVMVVQAVIGSSSCLVLAMAGNLYFGPRAGAIAGLLLALCPAAVFADLLIQKSVLDLLLVGLLLASLGSALRDPSPRRWAMTGAVLGGFMLTRENAVAFLPLLVLYLLFHGKGQPVRTRIHHVAGVLLGMSLILAPVATRNMVRGGELFLTSAQFGYNLYIGNNSGSDGTYTPLIPGREGKEQRDARELAEAALRRPLSYGEVSRYWRDQSLAYMADQPVAWLRVMAHKVFLLVNALELPDSYDQYTYGDWSTSLRFLTRFFHFGILLPLAAAGIAITWNRRSTICPLYLLVLSYAGSVVIFFVMARYRLPLVPMLILFAAAFIAEVVALRERPLAKLTAPLAVMLVAAVIGNWPSKYDAEKPRFKSTLLNNIVATIADQPGRDEEVIRLVTAALHLDPGFGPSYYYLGQALKNLRRYAESLIALRRSIALLPDVPEPYHLMGKVCFEAGKPAEAVTWYQKALSIDPEEPLWIVDLSRALRAVGDAKGAEDAVRRAMIIGGGDPRVRSAIAGTR